MRLSGHWWLLERLTEAGCADVGPLLNAARPLFVLRCCVLQCREQQWLVRELNDALPDNLYLAQLALRNKAA